MDGIQLIILILATWRVSSLLVYEDGPFEMFERLRDRAGVVYDERSQRNGANELAQALICLWCTSTWIAGGWVALFALSDWFVWLALPFALSSGAIAVETLVSRENHGLD